MNTQIEPTPVAVHTPGEWRVSDDGRFVIGGTIKDHQNPALNGCQLYIADCIISREYRPVEEAQANAALIASAPRLARENAALREALAGVIAVADRDTVEFDAARAAMALSSPSQAVLPPEPPSDAATGTPEGKEGANYARLNARTEGGDGK